jgi:hypothetical protein
VSDHTVRHYLDALVSTFVIRELQPWHANIADSGLLHFLLDIRSLDGLLSHPKSGASWEGFGIGEAVARLAERDLALERLYVIHAGARMFRMDRKILAVPLSRVRLDVSPLPAGAGVSESSETPRRPSSDAPIQ